jgi:hypothetical protein
MVGLLQLLLAQSLPIQIASRLLPFPPLPPPSCRCSHLSPPTLSARFALLDPTSLRRGRLDRRITLALPSHTTPGECDAEPVIVTASDVGGPMAKIPRDDRCEFCLAAPGIMGVRELSLRVCPFNRLDGSIPRGLITPTRSWLVVTFCSKPVDNGPLFHSSNTFRSPRLATLAHRLA